MMMGEVQNNTESWLGTNILCDLHEVAHLTHQTTFWGKYNNYFHQKDEKTKAQSSLKIH